MDASKAAELRAIVQGHDADANMTMSYRVAGRGIEPTTIRFTRGGRLRSTSGDSAVAPATAQGVFAALSDSLPAMVIRQEAAFPPDSVLGIVTLDVGGEQIELFFLADAEQAATAGAPLPPVVKAIERAVADARPSGPAADGITR